MGKGAFLPGDTHQYTKLRLEDLTFKDLRMIDRCYRKNMREAQAFSSTIVELAKMVQCDTELIQARDSSAYPASVIILS